MDSPEARPYANTTCPYCGVPMLPLPKAKSRCRSCGRPVWVRSGPDGFRYLLQEADLPTLQAAWAEVHDAQDAARLRDAASQSAAYVASALRSYLDAGVTFVEIIGGDDPCPACLAARAAGVFPIGSAPGYPVPGCTSDICRCDYVPASWTIEGV